MYALDGAAPYGGWGRRRQSEGDFPCRQPPVALGAWLSAEMQARGLTQKWVADRIPGLTDVLVSRVCLGRRTLKARKLLDLLRLFGYAVPIPQPGQPETPRQKLGRLVATSLDEAQSQALLAYIEALSSPSSRD